MKKHMTIAIFSLFYVSLQTPVGQTSSLQAQRDVFIALNKLIERFRKQGMAENDACARALRIMESLKEQQRNRTIL